MKAKFIGEPGTNESKNLPEVFEAYGVEFPQGKFVDVPEGVASKLAGNGHFEVKEEGKKEPEKEPKAETLPELSERIKTVTDLDALQQELQGEQREGGKAALQARIDELLAK